MALRGLLAGLGAGLAAVGTAGLKLREEKLRALETEKDREFRRDESRLNREHQDRLEGERQFADMGRLTMQTKLDERRIDAQEAGNKATNDATNQWRKTQAAHNAATLEETGRHNKAMEEAATSRADEPKGGLTALQRITILRSSPELGAQVAGGEVIRFAPDKKVAEALRAAGYEDDAKILDPTGSKPTPPPAGQLTTSADPTAAIASEPATAPAPAAATTYKSDAEVKAAYQAGKLTREQAAQILQSQFGYE